MHTPRIQPGAPLTRQLVAQGVFKTKPMCLADVGASGGINQYWNVFGKSLRAFGFDPLIKEVERLNSLLQDGTQRYFPYLVGYKRYDELVPPSARKRAPNVFPRTSAARAAEIARCDYVRTHFDQTGEGVYTTEMIELDEFFLRAHPADVDFVKIDTDGSDYQVLLGAQELLGRTPVLGVGIECQFHGLVHDQSNVFSNIDRLLRRLGYSLFDIEVYRYSRAVLPKPFVYRIPAQTHAGQVLWADALYLRDAGDKEYEATWEVDLAEHKILKLACLFEIFGIGDCAAELLLKYRDRLAGLIDLGACLDLLTPEFQGQRLPYGRYLEVFERNPEAFYPPA